MFEASQVVGRHARHSVRLEFGSTDKMKMMRI